MSRAIENSRPSSTKSLVLIIGAGPISPEDLLLMYVVQVSNLTARFRTFKEAGNVVRDRCFMRELLFQNKYFCILDEDATLAGACRPQLLNTGSKHIELRVQ